VKGFTLIELMISMIIIIIIIFGSCALTLNYVTSKSPSPETQCSSICDARDKVVFSKDKNSIVCKCTYPTETIYFRITDNNITKIKAEKK